MSQPDPTEQTLVRRLSATLQSVNALANSMPDLQQAVQDLLNLVGKKNQQIAELQKALDAATKMRKADMPSAPPK